MYDKFWIDANIYIKFEKINRVDLIDLIIPKTATVNSGEGLIKELKNSGFGIQQAINFDNPEKKLFIISDGTFGEQTNNSLKFGVLNIGTESMTYNMPIADKEAIFLGKCGYILISDDFKHIRKLAEKNKILCTGAIGILAANCLNGTLTSNWAGRYCKALQRIDERYLPQNFNTFSDIINDKNYLEEIKEIFNI